MEVHLDLMDDIEIPGDVTENLLRILREAMTNAAKHGASNEVTVRLERADGVRLVVEDDGCGFDLQGDSRTSGFGLLSMKERAESIGGSLNLESAACSRDARRGGGAVTAPIDVLLADDHARTRAMVRAALEQGGDFRVCAEAADAESALLEAERARPDVCLLDINMPGSGIAAAARITTALPGTAVVMLTVSRQDEDLFDALRAGASGYLLKGMDEDRIGDALHRVLNGEATLPGTLVARLVEEFRDREHRRVAVPEGPGRPAHRSGVGRARADARRRVDRRDLRAALRLTDHRAQPCLRHSAQARRPQPGGRHQAARAVAAPRSGPD